MTAFKLLFIIGAALISVLLVVIVIGDRLSDKKDKGGYDE